MNPTGQASEAGAAGQAAAASGPGASSVPGAPGLLATLDEAMLPADPMDLFEAWMGDVIRAGLPEPTAMVLSTVSADQRPRGRMVLLKAADVTGFTFYTNRSSRKASDLAEMPLASLLRDRFLAAVAEGWGDSDWSAIGRISYQEAGLRREAGGQHPTSQRSKAG